MQTFNSMTGCAEDTALLKKPRTDVFVLGKWVDQGDAIDHCGCPHVLGVKRLRLNFQARSEEHAVPVREAVSARERQRLIEYKRRGQSDREKTTISIEDALEFPTLNPFLVLQTAQKPQEFGQHLPRDCHVLGLKTELAK